MGKMKFHFGHKISNARNYYFLTAISTVITIFVFAPSINTNTFAQEVSQPESNVEVKDETRTSEYNITAASTYNEILNPRQIEYPAHLGFNDLHIEADNHMNPNSTQGHNPEYLDVIVHHHCKVYDDLTASCLLFPTGMGDQDKPYGIEYVIPAELYNTLPGAEKKYWHYHLTELPKVHATTPDLTPDEAAKVSSVLNETYGKVVYFWQLGDELPIGQPKAIIIEDIIDEAENLSNTGKNSSKATQG
jgi:uncharacterized protein involved in high-affinity Fe2+ transport